MNKYIYIYILYFTCYFCFYLVRGRGFFSFGRGFLGAFIWEDFLKGWNWLLLCRRRVDTARYSSDRGGGGGGVDRGGPSLWPWRTPVPLYGFGGRSQIWDFCFTQNWLLQPRPSRPPGGW